MFFSGSGLTSEQFMKKPQNEPVLQYKKGSEERIALENALTELSGQTIDVPIVIGKEKIYNKQEGKQFMPTDHHKILARYTNATAKNISDAILAAREAREKWDRKPLLERAEILLRAADLLAGKYRMKVNAATMLGQGKNIVQAEIDSTCELTDFFRFNAKFALDQAKYQPNSTSAAKNSMIFRGLEGFVAAITPFNFTSIGGNLATAPTLMGNVVLWKPASTAILSNYIVFQVLEEAGMPPGVISFLPSKGSIFGTSITESPHLAGINFTGSVPTFQWLWKAVAKNIDKYITFPKLVGECGGKNFHFIHPSADVAVAAACTMRAGYEYQGQKCSACSRLYVPESLWPEMRKQMSDIAKQIKVGDVRDGSIFMGGIIDESAFHSIVDYIEYAKTGADGAKIIYGGGYDSTKGYFIQPTLVEVEKWDSKLLKEEIFGPIITAYVYKDSDIMKVMHGLKDATAFGLTGSIFAQDKEFLEEAKDVLRDAVGNMYTNDKSTGAVVGQQPFGGARMSGTNDKAGGPHYVLRWTSPLCIKEALVPMNEWRYPSMD
uniref:Multifunctional fusion protein n=1 Tax=Syphacia muris TaxID=451379 RepID=A0A0N5AWL2_9BILA